MTVFRTIVADPPWKYGDALGKRGAEDHYKTVMSTDDICKLSNSVLHTNPLEAWNEIMGHRIALDALLWLWVTEPFLLNGDGPRVCREWLFEPKTRWTWIKGRVADDAIVGPKGLGHYLRVATESVILAGRGKATSLVQTHSLDNYTLVAPRRAHSEKPEEFYAMVEALSPGPYLELFARRQRPGWTCVGDELPPSA